MSAKPPPVDDHYRYWNDPPPEMSERCAWYVNETTEGRFAPNRCLRTMGYDEGAEYLGVYIWEYWNVLLPAWSLK